MDNNKYKNGKIYTIRYRNDDSLIYVGSTTQPLYKRFSVHKAHSKISEKENVQLYQKFNTTDTNDWYIELYEDYPCERREQLTSSDFGVSTGLISQGYWEWSRWYFVNVERSQATDKQPRNINISFLNNSNVPIDCLVFIFYSDEFVINVETGIIEK